MIKWEGIKPDPGTLNLSIKVADADMLSSEPLGEISLPVSKFPEGEDTMDAWYTLKPSNGMSEVKGSIRVQTRIEFPSEEGEGEAGGGEGDEGGGEGAEGG